MFLLTKIVEIKLGTFLDFLCGLLSTYGSLRTWLLGFGFWLDSLGIFAASSDIRIQITHPIIFVGRFRWWSRWHIYLLVYGFFKFHHNYFQDTISWECIVEDDCVRSCLMKLNWASCFSTQYTVSWCIFHCFWLYHARRGALKSISYGSLCSLFMGSTAVKNTVCLLLKFCPPGVNPEFVMEWKLTAHPIW